MANKIILKKSSVADKVPLPGDLDFGELALNYRDGWLYYKDVNGNVQILNDAPPSGTGSGADADLLDGIDSTEFLRSNVSDQYTNGTLSFNNGTTTEFLNTGVGSLTATLSTGTALVTVADTTGLVAGQTLTKISGVGAFGAAATILSVDNATEFTASINHATAGDIVFSAGRSPFNVTSSVVVANLNADLLDGRDYLFFYSPDNPPPPPGLDEESDTLQTVTERGATSNIATISLTGGTASTNTTTGTLVVTGGVGVSSDINVGGLVNITGTLSHTGLVPTSGTAIDQITTVTRSITLTTDWQDTGIQGTDLATGTYIVQLYANDTSAGGTNSNEYYSGTMSWYSGVTGNSLELPTDEIVLHRAGASSEAGMYLRTYRTPEAGGNGILRLQIYSNLANASASNYVFKFRRMI
jgi:hypothetical protein